MDERSGESPTDAFLEALCHAERRRLLLDLLEAGDRDEAAIQPGEGRRGMDNVDRLAMHHAHLPKLEEFGLVECDPDTGRVRRGPRFGEIVPLLRSLPESRNGPPDEPDGTPGNRRLTGGRR